VAFAAMALSCRAAEPAATANPADWSCGAVHGEARAKRRLGAHGRLSLGVVADTNGTAPATLAHLRRFAALFADAHVDAVLALGDLGASEDEIATVLTALGAARAPIFALAGEREPEAAFHAAVKRARAGGVDVLDLVDVRLVDAGDVDLVAAPGYPFSDKGCRYRAADLDGARRLAGGRMRPLILAAHTPPKGRGPAAVDWAVGEINAGDPAMLDLVNALYPNLALFAHIDESGGHVERGSWINVGGVESKMAMVVELERGIPHPRVLR
jgi:hypothetical protein